jgi:hypothetical protein
MSNLEKIKKLKKKLQQSEKRIKVYKMACEELITISKGLVIMLDQREQPRRREIGSAWDYAHGM